MQIDGIRESILQLSELVGKEVELLGDARRVIVGGFSQGAALVGMLMLAGELEVGGWVGMSGWLPFRGQLEEVAVGCVVDGDAGVKEVYAARRKAVVAELRGILGIETRDMEAQVEGGSEMRLWMGHGVSDEKVKLEWGEQMRNVMKNAGVRVEMHTYEELGHWYSGSEMADLFAFLEGRWMQFLGEEG